MFITRINKAPSGEFVTSRLMAIRNQVDWFKGPIESIDLASHITVKWFFLREYR